MTLQFSKSFQILLTSQQRDCPRRQLVPLQISVPDQRYKDLGRVQKPGREEKGAIGDASQIEIHLLTTRQVSFNPEYCSVTSPLPEPTCRPCPRMLPASIPEERRSFQPVPTTQQHSTLLRASLKAKTTISTAATVEGAIPETKQLLLNTS